MAVLDLELERRRSGAVEPMTCAERL